MASSDLGNDFFNNRRINKVELIVPDQNGVETLNHDGLEVSIDKNATAKFTRYTANGEIILVRAGAEAQQIEFALNQSMDKGGHINPTDFLSRTLGVAIPKDTPLQRTIDVIFVENRFNMNGETSRVTHVQRGDPKLSRLQTEINGPNSQYVIAERSLEPGTEKITQWQIEQMSQGKTRTVVFVEGESSLSARLTGGNRLSLEGDNATFPVTGTKREFPQDFQKPLMHVITEADVKGRPIPTAEITTRVNLVTLNSAQGVVVIR